MLQKTWTKYFDANRALDWLTLKHLQLQNCSSSKAVTSYTWNMQVLCAENVYHKQCSRHRKFTSLTGYCHIKRHWKMFDFCCWKLARILPYITYCNLLVIYHLLYIHIGGMYRNFLHKVWDIWILKKVEVKCLQHQKFEKNAFCL